jgi:hypothetical protein
MLAPQWCSAPQAVLQHLRRQQAVQAACILVRVTDRPERCAHAGVRDGKELRAHERIVVYVHRPPKHAAGSSKKAVVLITSEQATLLSILG